MGDEVEEAQPSRGGLVAHCAVCVRVLTLTKAGLVRTHGPVANRCPGSRTPPDASGDSPTPTEDVQVSRLTTQREEACSQRPLSKPRVKPIRRIPRASREPAAKKLASVIEAVVANPASVPACDRFLHFSARCLRAPTRGGRRWNLARVINDQIRTESDPVPSLSPENPHGRRKHRKVRAPLESLAGGR